MDVVPGCSSDVEAQWCSQGDLLAVAGMERHGPLPEAACASVVRNALVKFYNVQGEHIYTLETPAQVSSIEIQISNNPSKELALHHRGTKGLFYLTNQSLCCQWLLTVNWFFSRDPSQPFVGVTETPVCSLLAGRLCTWCGWNTGWPASSSCASRASPAPCARRRTWGS